MTPKPNNRFIWIGSIGKSRGLNGVVRFLPAEKHNLTDDFFDEIKIVYIKNERSDLMPMRIESVHHEKKRNQFLFFVKFDLITNRKDAEKYKDRLIYSDSDVIQVTESTEKKHLPVGFTVFYKNRKFGVVDSVIDNPAHPILTIITDKNELLVPFVDEYVDKTDQNNNVVYCKNLDQLTDL